MAANNFFMSYKTFSRVMPDGSAARVDVDEARTVDQQVGSARCADRGVPTKELPNVETAKACFV